MNAASGGAAPLRIDADWLRDPGAAAVMAAMAAGGARAYFVGGCVRNALLGLPAADLDIATDARPPETRRLLEAAGLRAVPTGIAHGTITAVALGRAMEITTFRADIATDGRRAAVAFADDPAVDAARRDFTMNALYADARGVVLDPLGGLGDLRARRVRFIGDAAARIREDYLRILRFFRFHAWYGAGGVDAEGLAACAATLDGLATLSRERVGSETRKLLAAPDPAPAVAAMAACGALARVLPGAEAAILGPLVEVERLADAAPDWRRRLAGLCAAALGPVSGGGSDVGLGFGVGVGAGVGVGVGIGAGDEADAETEAGVGGGVGQVAAPPPRSGVAALAERLRLSRAEARGIEAIAGALADLHGGAGEIARAAHRHGADATRHAALIRAAALAAPPPPELEAEIARGAAARFPLAAADLMARGVPPGPGLGRLLKVLEARWRDSGFAQDRRGLLAEAFPEPPDD